MFVVKSKFFISKNDLFNVENIVNFGALLAMAYLILLLSIWIQKETGKYSNMLSLFYALLKTLLFKRNKKYE